MVRPYPIHTLEDALGVASTIQSVNAGLPFDRKLLARALGTTPASSGYTMKLNSSAKYGLTEGAYNDAEISLTQRGEAIVAPRDEHERRESLLQASMAPEVFGRFYQLLDGKRMPEDTYAQNMIQREFGIQPVLAREDAERLADLPRNFSGTPHPAAELRIVQPAVTGIANAASDPALLFRKVPRQPFEKDRLDGAR